MLFPKFTYDWGARAFLGGGAEELKRGNEAQGAQRKERRAAGSCLVDWSSGQIVKWSNVEPETRRTAGS